MLKYYILDKENKTVVTEVQRDEFEILVNFLKKYKYFENLYHSFLCGNDSIRDYRRLLEEVNKEKFESDINLVHKLGIYNVTAMILMLRLVIDNTKSYNKKTMSATGKKAVNAIEQIYEIKLLKALRDYAQHYSIPVTNTTLSFSSVDEEMKVHFTINKEELLENKENKKNIITISSIAKEKVTFSELVDIWEKEINILIQKVMIDFVESIPSKPRKILIEKFNPRESEGKIYYPNAILIKEGKYEVTKDIKVMDSELTKFIVGSLNYYKKHGTYE